MHSIPLAVVISTSGMLTGMATERATSALIASIIAPPSVERGGCAAASLSAACAAVAQTLHKLMTSYCHCAGYSGCWWEARR